MDFLPSLSVIAAFSLAAVFLTLTPGPDMIFFLGRTIAQGRAAGLAAYFGAALGVVFHTTAAAIGLSALLAASPTGFTILKVAGAAYLLFLAVGALRHGSAFRLDGEREEAEPLRRVFRNGLTINLLNPKIIVFFVTFLPQFIDAGDQNAGAKLFFLGMLFIAVATPITIVMILSAERLAVFLRSSPRAMRAFDWGFAGVMGAFAVKLAMTQSR